jgi:RND family efflux transporter MFP subunit
MLEYKSKLLFVILVAIFTLTAGFAAGILIGKKSPVSGESAQGTVSPGKQLYSCGMHPEIIRDKPGNCPICGMKLTPLKSTAAVAAMPQGERKIKYWRAPMDPTYISDKPGKSPMGMDLIPVYEDEIQEGAVAIDPITIQNMGLKTAPVKSGNLTRTIRTVGNVDYNEENLYIINTKITGWIEKLYVNTTGQMVEKGQPILEIYSPELVSTQEEYLTSLKGFQDLKDSPYQEARNGALELLNSTRTRLEYWDIDEDQIKDLEQTGKIKKTLTIYSPARGVVIHKNVIEGAHVNAGSDLFQIADLSTVWVQAAIYEYELPYIKLGQKATVTMTYLPGETFEGRLTYIYPYLSEKTRDVKVRLEFPNPGFELKPDMYANAVIESKLPGERILIPQEAVIHSGKREIVFVDLGQGKYSPREIVTGASGEGDVVEVKKGLLPGEVVVTSAQFMLDSESKTQEAIQKMIKTKTAAASTEMEETSVSSAKTEVDSVTEISQVKAKNLNLTPEKKAEHAEDVYTCPMDEHSYVLQVGPGKCPECGMGLVPVTETGRIVYTCPMPEHHNVLSNVPGKCPVCGMDLVPLKKKTN